jgi:SAM-dependent methyltransferase
MSNPRGKINYAQIIENDPFLLMIYDDVYRSFYEIASKFGGIPGKTLELGAGDFSLADKYFLDVKKSDIRANPEHKSVEEINSEFLPFSDESFDCVIAKDVLHHFKNPYSSLSEIKRVLKPKGVFIVSEPYWSLLGRFIFKFIHPENWNVSPTSLNLKSINPWDSNQALLYLLNGKFKDDFCNNVPDFDLKILNSGYGITYALSGGVFSRTNIPSGMLINFKKFESKIIRYIRGIVGLNVFGVFEKRFSSFE